MSDYEALLAAQAERDRLALELDRTQIALIDAENGKRIADEDASAAEARADDLAARLQRVRELCEVAEPYCAVARNVLAALDAPLPQSAPAEADKPHPFHMSSYVGPQPRCWCDRYADHPVHRHPACDCGAATHPSPRYRGEHHHWCVTKRAAAPRLSDAPAAGEPHLCAACRSDDPDAHGGCYCGRIDGAHERHCDPQRAQPSPREAPEPDTAAIREWTHTGYWPPGTDVDETLELLCDEVDSLRAQLSAAQAEREALREQVQHQGAMDGLRAQLSAAHAELDNWESQCTTDYETIKDLEARLAAVEAALERVREAAAMPLDDSWVLARVRAALDQPDERP